jgi:hypothetical protein
MGAGREGVDLLNKLGRRAFWRGLRRGRFNRMMWRDTFGRVLCWLSGEHVIHQTFYDENKPPETYCLCCCKWLYQHGHKWKTKP